jgi:hypothetical protein
VPVDSAQFVVPPATEFDASLNVGQSGLVGTIQVQIVAPGEQTVLHPRTTEGITEFPVGSGVYGVTLKSPLPPGLYAVIWDTAGGGALTPQNTYLQQLVVQITDPEWPGGWSWTPWGWLQPDDASFNIATGAVGSNPVPTAADVRAASKLDFIELGYGADAGPGGLQEVVDRAESAFWRITGQEIDAVTPKFAPMVRRVIQGMAEHQCLSGQPDVLETTEDWDLITSFSAGPYSETRRSAAEMFQGRMLHPVPWISQALWSLCSYERYGFWLSFFGGYNVPAFATSDVFWGEGQDLARMYGPSAWWGYTFGA